MAESVAVYLLITTLLTALTVFIAGVTRLDRVISFGSLYLLIMYLTYVIRPVMALALDGHLGTMERVYDVIDSRLIMQSLDRFAIVYGVALVSFGLAYRLYPRRAVPIIDSPTRALTPWQRQTVWRIVAVMIVAGYASFLVAQRGFLGFGERGAEFVVTSGGTGLTNTSGYVELANYLVVSGALLYYALSSRLGIVLLLTLPWVANQVYYGYYRFMILVLYFGTFAVWLLTQHTIEGRTWHRFVAPLLALAVVGYVVGVRGDRLFATQGRSLTAAVEKSAQQPWADVMGDLAGFEGSWYMVETAELRRPKLGASIFYQYAVKPIPRVFWQAKPFPLGFTWATVFTGRTEIPLATDSIWWSGPVKGSIGLAIEEWGLYGMFVPFVFTAVVLAFLEERLSRVGTSTVFWLAAYGATYAMITTLGRIDIFLGSVNHVLLFYAPYAAAAWWVLNSRPAQRQRRIELFRAARAKRLVEARGTQE